MRKFICFVSLGAFYALFMTSCLKDSSDTIALPEIVVVEDVPDDVIPAEIRDEFETHMTINEGKMPPYIQGEYVINRMVLSYNSVGDYKPGKVFADCYMAFLNQISGSCRYAEKQGGGTSSSDKVYVTGSGSDFTAYFVARNEHGDGHSWSVMSTLVSGTITESGIRNCEYAFILVDKYDPDSKIMPVNGYRVFYDDDYLASREAWYDGAEKAPHRMPAHVEMLEMNAANK